MVKELRELVFSAKDLIEAIKIFPNKKSLKLPDGKITGLSIVDDAYVFAIVQVVTPLDEKMEDAVLDAPILAALMLYYCKTHNIPIPKNAEKKIAKVEAGLSFSIKLS